MSIIEKFVSLYAPHQCVGCSVEGGLLCSECCNRIGFAPSCCYRCRRPARSGRTCGECLTLTPLLSINAITTYEGCAKDLLWSLKFERGQAAASIIAELMFIRFGERIGRDVLIVPIPTARRRVRSRGYDQAVMIARALAKRSGCRYAPLLLRHGSQEQKRASQVQRQRQLQGAYTVRRPSLASGARVLLIDDVLTTGATLEEAASMLRLAGVRAVGGLVFARA